MRRLNKDEQIQIGDVVITEHPIGGKHNYPITRLTKRFAFSKVRADYEVKFPCKFELYFQKLPREKYNQTIYTVWRKNG